MPLSQEVILNGLGSATLIFSGYRTGKPLPDIGTALDSPPAYTPVPAELANYRTIMVQPLTFCLTVTGVPVPQRIPGITC